MPMLALAFVLRPAAASEMLNTFLSGPAWRRFHISESTWPSSTEVHGPVRRSIAISANFETYRAIHRIFFRPG